MSAKSKSTLRRYLFPFNVLDSVFSRLTISGLIRICTSAAASTPAAFGCWATETTVCSIAVDGTSE